jgi:hypothetical protein
MIEYKKENLKKLTNKNEIKVGGCYIVFTTDWTWVRGKYLWVKVKETTGDHLRGTWTFSDGHKTESGCDIDNLLKDGYILERPIKNTKIYGIVEFCKKYY